MPKIINEYANENPLAEALKGFAGSFGGNTAQTELYRQKALGLGRENTNIPLVAPKIAAGDYQGALEAAVAAGMDPKNLGGYGQYFNVNKFGPGSAEGTTATMAVPGANYGNTVQGTQAAEANKRGIAQMQTDRLVAADMRKFDNTFETVMDPVTKQPTLVPRSQAAGRQPFLPLSQVQGGILQQDAPTLTAPQRAAAGGYAPKNPANVWVYRKPDGSMANTLDGTTDAQTGQPITGPAMKLEGANTDGLTGNNSVDQKLLEARNAKDIAVQSINNLQASLSKPNADQSVGYLGAVARGFTDLRAQAEATVRLFGGEMKDQAFVTPDAKAAVDDAMRSIFTPERAALAQARGIDANIVRSQVQDLAYMIAKAQDPGGRVSTDDIRRAAQTVGGMIMDPKASIAVLDDLKNRLETSHAIRERNTRAMYPGIRQPVDTPAPQPGQPAAPVATQQSDPLGIR